MLISAIVASRNRCRTLKPCLEHLCRAANEIPGACEIIVVDNNSDDNTRDVVAAFVRESPELVRYLHEPRQGKSGALNRGMAAAKGTILAFTDDDCYVSQSWFRSIAEEFQSDGMLGGLSGRVELFDELDCPVSVRTLTERCLLNSPELALTIPIGCNMAFSRHVIDLVGPFDPALGPGSPGGAVAEDADFVYRVWKAGYKLIYTPGVLLYHHHGRRVPSELAALRRNYVVGRGAFYLKHILKGDWVVAKLAYWEVSNHLRRITTMRGSSRNDGRPHLLRHLIRGAKYGLNAKFAYRREGNG